MVGLKDRAYARFINNTEYLPEDNLNFYKETYRSIFFIGHIYKMGFLLDIFIYYD
jgi:hypothetical protein